MIQRRVATLACMLVCMFQLSACHHAPARTEEPPPDVKTPAEADNDAFEALARSTADYITDRPQSTALAAAPDDSEQDKKFAVFGQDASASISNSFFKGRYDRSRARSPENIDSWRSRPDIANPGPDIANFPNSAFTLPEGRAYVELAPFNFSGAAHGAVNQQFYTQFLLRYGLTDDIELRLMGNGMTLIHPQQGNSVLGFSPLQFDTKINLWLEKKDYYLPAAGIEMYVQTPWMANPALNQSTQPYLALLFDQSLPWDINLEYNIGTSRTQTPMDINVWQLIFQWALQKDILDDDVAIFAHGSYSSWTQSLNSNPHPTLDNPLTMTGNLMGGGLIWTINSQFAVFGQVSGPLTQYTPSMNSMLGFAAAF